MPYIKTRTTVEIAKDKEEAIKSKLGKAIESFPGKTENWLMTDFEDNCRLWFKGDNSQPSAFVEVKVFGKSTDEAFDKMTSLICEILNSELSIPTDRIYVKYEEVEHWGWNGFNF